MRYAIIENGIIINVAESESALADNWILDFDAQSNIGGTWDGSHFYPPTSIINVSVSPRQIRQALTATGLRDQVEAAVAAGNQHLKDWWEFSTSFERNHPEVLAMAQALSVTDDQLDDLWRLAVTL